MLGTASPVWNQISAKDAAEAAFYLQTSGNYSDLVDTYDAETLSQLAIFADDIITAHEKKPDEIVEAIFGTADSKKLRSLEATTLVSQCFAFFFGAKRLTEEERELLRGASFEFVDAESIADDLVDVAYRVVFVEEVKTAVKSMRLRRHQGRWFITIKPDLLQLFRTTLGLPTMQ